MKNAIIATVDYNDYISGDAEKKAAFIEKFGESLSRIGFAIVANHGVTEDLKNSLYETSKEFFDLPEDAKRKYEDTTNGGQRGYISKGRETAKGFKVPDLKEFYHVGQEVQGDDPIKNEYSDNIWVNEVPALETVGKEVYRKFENTGRNLLKAIAIYLDLEEDYFSEKIYNGNSILRLLHYFPIENPESLPKDSVRAAAHEDINLITLLMGANAEGLQAKRLNGEWASVSPEPNQIVINIGDMLQRLTNGKLRSTSHRVVNPPKEKLKTSRYSTPFFLHPRSNMSLNCLESCITEEKPKQFEDITAGAYLDERIKELGLK